MATNPQGSGWGMKLTSLNNSIGYVEIDTFPF